MYRSPFRSASSFYDYLTAGLFTFLFFAGRLGDGGLRSDNILYAAVSKSLLHTDNPLLLNVGGTAYLNKPPLFFWINGFFMNLFGTNVFSAKLATALGAAGIAILIFKIAKDAFKNVNAGYAAVIFFCFNYIIFKVSHGCRIESILTLFIIAGIMCAAAYAEHKNTFALLFSGVFLGLAVLTKGYQGVLAYGCVLLYLVFSFRRFKLPKLAFDIILATAVFAGVFGWWYLYAFKHSDFFNVFFVVQSTSRLSFGEVQWDSQPLYTYAVSFFSASIIMLPFLIGGIRKHFHMLHTSPALAMMSIYSVIYIVGIHFLATKFDRYLYSVIPYFCIIASGGFISLFRFNLQRPVMWLSVAFILFFCFYPGTLGTKGYNELTDLQRIAERNGGHLCASTAFAHKWENQAALEYFTDGYITENCTNKDVFINYKEAFCDGYTLIKNDRYSACVKSK